jgi:hypothetical protein
VPEIVFSYSDMIAILATSLSTLPKALRCYENIREQLNIIEEFDTNAKFIIKQVG